MDKNVLKTIYYVLNVATQNVVNAIKWCIQ